jgi:ribose transport system permease protein
MKRAKEILAPCAALLVAWIAVVILFSILSERFFSPATFSNLATQIPPLAVVATGMTLVIITAGIDLSVGSVLGMAGAVFGASLVIWQLPLPLAGLLAIATGTLAGSFNGWISAWWKVPSFIVTLGMLEIARGIAYHVTDSKTMYLDGSLAGLSAPLQGIGLPPSFFVAVSIVLATHLILIKTVYGRRLMAIGANETAVTLAGIRTLRLKASVFVIAGAFSGLGALLYTSRLGSADPNAGIGLELSAIAAVVIGGTSLEGGRGSVLNTFLGVLIIATLEAGLAQMGASEPLKRIITGGVIVAASCLDAYRNHGSLRFAWLRQKRTAKAS